MISLLTETTERLKVRPACGWILYDQACSSCSRLARLATPLFARRGFDFEPLQEHWIQQRLGLSPEEALAEMRVLTRDGTTYGGAEAVIFLARQVWWMAPLHWLAHFPRFRTLLHRLYRQVAANRTCSIAQRPQSTAQTRRAFRPLLILPLLALGTRPLLPSWAFMWTMAVALFFGCKWLTLRRTRERPPLRAAAYLLAWPGMDAPRFLSQTPPARPPFQEVALASGRFAFGATLLFGVARLAPQPLLAGWIGMVGMVLLLHFGLFHLLSIWWRWRGVDAPPIMNAPLRSTSVGEFWSRRWNGAFNQLALQLVFRPVARRVGTTVATLTAFLVSGFVHELVISLPAGAGYGLPTGYFLMQGAALLVEHRLGMRSWLFTMLVVAAPAYWLFHPPFVARVILPFMQTIGAL